MCSVCRLPLRGEERKRQLPCHRFLNPGLDFTPSFILGVLEIPSLEVVVFLSRQSVVNQLVPHPGGCQPSCKLSDLNESSFAIYGPFLSALIRSGTCTLASVEGYRLAKMQSLSDVCPFRPYLVLVIR